MQTTTSVQDVPVPSVHLCVLRLLDSFLRQLIKSGLHSRSQWEDAVNSLQPKTGPRTCLAVPSGQVGHWIVAGRSCFGGHIPGRFTQ